MRTDTLLCRTSSLNRDVKLDAVYDGEKKRLVIAIDIQEQLDHRNVQEIVLGNPRYASWTGNKLDVESCEVHFVRKTIE